jgi:hypothetical protein
MVRTVQTTQRIQKQAELLADEKTKVSVLLVILFDGFGNTDFFDWEPETVRYEIRTFWKTDIPQENYDKIWAALTLLTTDMFTQDLQAFIHICNAFTGSGADFNWFDPATVEEMSKTIAEAALLDPGSVDPKNFSDEILTYMSTQLDEQGFTKPPRVLARYVSGLGKPEEEIEDVLRMDGLDAKAYWNNQHRQNQGIEELIKADLEIILTQIAGLPLRHSVVSGLEQLKERVRRALAAQSQETTQAAEGLPARPVL